jgi:hypothetical protein
MGFEPTVGALGDPIRNVWGCLTGAKNVTERVTNPFQHGYLVYLYALALGCRL